ncbi:hypothetical protein BKA64DRAFT_24013 [Cadophora sp. MPI-SDFR-AT-0126]|nr:hypothetical protein BKA64DRAFT_24013 [Leotiomycetes sp. MPI-SDFR-AT-0126]
MAEILGVGISVASLVIQIVDSLSKAISFYESIREAPDDVQRLLIELHLLSNIISVIQNMVSTSSIPKDTESVLKSALTLIRRDVAALSSLSSELDDKLKSERRFIRTWARVQTVFSDKKISVLKRHLESTKGGMHLLQGCIIVDKISNLDFRAREIPKQLGYHWEAGERERHLKIDDGLDEPFFIPLDLCSNPEDLISLLDLKYRSRKLPGLSQIRQGHLAVFDWTRNFKVDFDNWNMVVKPGGRIKIAFLMSSWHGLSRTKCTRCFKPYKVGTTSFGFRNW